MKNLLFLLAIFFVMTGCHKEKTQEEKKDNEINTIIQDMKYNEYRDLEYTQFGYFIDNIRASERMGKILQFGNEEFYVYHYSYSTDGYPYRLQGKSYDLWINPESLFENRFTVMKTWNEIQAEFHPQSNIWTITRYYITGMVYNWIDYPASAIFAFLIGFAFAWIWAREKFSPKETPKK
jgi:hypothetical protein